MGPIVADFFSAPFHPPKVCLSIGPLGFSGLDRVIASIALEGDFAILPIYHFSPFRLIMCSLLRSLSAVNHKGDRH